jgi:mannose-1-phosphate guanylyltransferase
VIVSGSRVLLLLPAQEREEEIGMSPSARLPAREADAVVLVGGKGTRLRPLTCETPKPMLPMAGVPFLTHLLSRSAAVGIRRVVLSTSYRAEMFWEHFGDGEVLGLDLRYVVEPEPLGTAGAIRNVAGSLACQDVLVFNGDILSGADVPAVLDTHRKAGADVTLHLVKVSDPRSFGCVPTDAAGRVAAFLEKTDDPPTDQINAGCYVFSRRALESIPTGRPVSVERETFPELLARGAHLQGHVDSSYWLDVGTPAAFVRGSCDLVLGMAPSAALPGGPGEALVLGGARVAEQATLAGGSTVGAGSAIATGAAVRGSVVFDGAVIEQGASVCRSAIGAGARIGTGAVLTDAVVGDRAVIGAGCELASGARVWPEVVLPAGGLRFSADA